MILNNSGGSMDRELVHEKYITIFNEGFKTLYNRGLCLPF